MEPTNKGVAWRKIIASGGTACPNQTDDRYYDQDIDPSVKDPEERKSLVRDANETLNRLAGKHGGDVPLDAVREMLGDDVVNRLEKDNAVVFCQNGSTYVGFLDKPTHDFVLSEASSVRTSFEAVSLHGYLVEHGFQVEEQAKTDAPSPTKADTSAKKSKTSKKR